MKSRVVKIISFAMVAASSLMLPTQVTKASTGLSMNYNHLVKAVTNPYQAAGSVTPIRHTGDGQYALQTAVDDSTKIPVTSDKPAPKTSGCTRSSCSLYVEVDKSAQMMNVYLSGALQYSFPVSTGRPGHPTPDLDLRPQGPLYEKYTSTKYPEGDYHGLGNMPYAVFLKDGYAIHGTTTGSIRKLGTKASHGCVRLHPEDAKTFYELVKTVGLSNTWVTVH